MGTVDIVSACDDARKAIRRRIGLQHKSKPGGKIRENRRYLYEHFGSGFRSRVRVCRLKCRMLCTCCAAAMARLAIDLISANVDKTSHGSAKSCRLQERVRALNIVLCE